MHIQKSLSVVALVTQYDNTNHYISAIMSHRDAVDVKGLDEVAASDGVSQSAIQTLIWVNGCYCGDGGTHRFGPLAQHCDILLLRKFWGIVILVHDANVYGC